MAPAELSLPPRATGTLQQCVVGVGVVAMANNRAPGGTPGLTAACQRRLRQIMCGGCVVIDHQGLMVRHYVAELRGPGQGGVGGVFLKWLLSNHATGHRCRQVDIRATHLPDQCGDMDSAPGVAFRVAAEAGSCSVVDVQESLAWQRRADLTALGIPVDVVCANELARDSDQGCPGRTEGRFCGCSGV